MITVLKTCCSILIKMCRGVSWDSVWLNGIMTLLRVMSEFSEWWVKMRLLRWSCMQLRAFSWRKFQMLKKIAALKRPKHRENVIPLSWIATVAFVHARERALKKITCVGTLRWTFTYYVRFTHVAIVRGQSKVAQSSTSSRRPKFFSR